MTNKNLIPHIPNSLKLKFIASKNIVEIEDGSGNKRIIELSESDELLKILLKQKMSQKNNVIDRRSRIWWNRKK